MIDEKVKDQKYLNETGAKRYAETIEILTGINVFHKSRFREYVYKRSVLNYALKTSHNWGLSRISRLYVDNGYDGYDHATVWHSLKMFEIYVKYEPSLLDLFKNLCKKEKDLGIYKTFIFNKMQGLKFEELEKVELLVNRYYNNADKNEDRDK